jgi:predicted DNA-binding protein
MPKGGPYKGGPYIDVAMAITKRQPGKNVRRSVTLPAEIDRQVNAMAKQKRLSNSRLLVELIEEGIEAAKQKEKAFFITARRLREASHAQEINALGDEVGRTIFGE